LIAEGYSYLLNLIVNAYQKVYKMPIGGLKIYGKQKDTSLALKIVPSINISIVIY